MSYNSINATIARRKMFLKNKNHSLSFVTTVWNGEVIMCVLNNINKKIVNVFCIQDISSDDLKDLESLVVDFVSN